jgi:hypothetical protein
MEDTELGLGVPKRGKLVSTDLEEEFGLGERETTAKVGFYGFYGTGGTGDVL